MVARHRKGPAFPAELSARLADNRLWVRNLLTLPLPSPTFMHMYETKRHLLALHKVCPIAGH